MAAINANMNDSIGWVPLSEADATNIEPGSYTLGSENVEIGGPHPTVPSRHDSPLNGRWVQRARAGSTAASHLSGATLTRYYADAPGDGGSGGVTVDNTVDPPFVASTLVASGASESAPGEATLGAARGFVLEGLAAIVGPGFADIPVPGDNTLTELVLSSVYDPDAYWSADLVNVGHKHGFIVPAGKAGIHRVQLFVLYRPGTAAPGDPQLWSSRAGLGFLNFSDAADTRQHVNIGGDGTGLGTDATLVAAFVGQLDEAEEIWFWGRNNGGGGTAMQVKYPTFASIERLVDA